MILAVGSGAYIAAIFLMVAHAFFKGLLFLGAGSVIHGLEDEQDLKRMGALRRYMKWTTVTFTIGFLAIAGIPPLSGFWAKGDVLDNTFAHYKPLWVIGVLTAVLTAYYMSRLEVLAFGGKERFDKPGPHGEPALHAPHESPWVMRLPLVVLAFFAFFAGALDLPWVHIDSLANFLAPVFAGTLYNDHLGAGPSGPGPGRHRGGPHRCDRGLVLWRGDEVYKPRWSRRSCSGSGTGTTSTTPSSAARPAPGHVLRLGGRRPHHRRRRQRHRPPGQGHRTAARKLQTGYARNYALGIAIGMALIIAFMLSRTWWG